MKELFSNVDLIIGLLDLPNISQLIAILVSVTQNNPWCIAIQSFLESGNQFKPNNLGLMPIDQKLFDNLSLMLTDLNEYLIARRQEQQEKTRKVFLQKSIDYIHAGEKIRCRVMRTSPLDAVTGKFDSLVADIANGEFSSALKVSKPRRCPKPEDMRLKEVNPYWIEANEMATRFMDRLAQPEGKCTKLEMEYINAKRLAKVSRVID